ncbi:MAG TPA: thiamine pyrophosphate-binding protein [Solirubrobacteraceae bacterium]|nr:thiamine pyrophosphate-binding protein [Solirubrobacteraceae bacterium]
MTGSDYTVGDYLAARLAEAGVNHVFGVPGDYTLALLDHVIASSSLRWVGCTNELNAGYACDGYARIRGIGALMTTFGVGELSAVNAVAGSYAEHVPVVHIVGSPASGTQAAHRIVHHSLGDGVFTHFLEMHQPITCARAALTPDNAVSEIDRVLTTVRGEHLPGYILLPADVAGAPARPPGAALPVPSGATDRVSLDGFVAAARRLIESAAGVQDVRVLGGLLVHRLGAIAELEALLRAGPLVHATSLWGKSLVDESDPWFAGVYVGAASDEEARRAVEDAPVLILAGVQFTDLNSGFFTQQITRTRTIEIGGASSSVGAALFGPIALPAALAALIPLIEEMARRAPGSAGSPRARPGVPRDPREGASQEPPDGAPLTQTSLWDTVAAFLRPHNVVLADQGCSFYGAATHRLPGDVIFIGQPLWASIGYTLPALLGACLARPASRGVLLIGDGAAQMTVQELSTVVREGIAPLVVVVDNDGYTVERAIHGPDQPYNDIARWDWTSALSTFAPGHACLSARVGSVAELRAALAEAESRPQRPAIIQAVVPRLDVPPLLAALARAAASANARRSGANG